MADLVAPPRAPVLSGRAAGALRSVGSRAILDGRTLWRAGVSGLTREAWVMIALAVVGVVAGGLNMFQYPSFTGFDDEGIYAAQAWAVLREGALSPYTYVYDHVPGGWMLVAAWMALTGGPHAFGTAIDSGRALMLLLHVASVLMLYRVARKLGCGVAVATFAATLFTISPLALLYQRRLLLDNIMLFWCLASLDLLLDGWGRLSRVSLSGICFAVALLTKETAVFLLPPMLYIAWQQRWQHQGRFALLGWFVPVVVVVSWYPLYAALKGELLPASSVQFGISGYGNTGVSLMDSLRWEIARDGGGPFNVDNQFWSLVRSDWLPRDALVLVGGTLATLFNAARGLRGQTAAQHRWLATALLGLCPLLYLARGGVVFDFYLLIVLPYLCLNLAVVIAALCSRVREHVKVVAMAGATTALAGTYVLTGALVPLYTQTPGQAGREAIAWIKHNLPSDAAIITRDDLWADLREPGPGGPAFSNVQSYTKVAGDPAIRSGVFADDWRRVDYLIVSPGLQQTLVDSSNAIALDALAHAHRVKAWSVDGSTLEVWKVDKAGPTEQALLQSSAAFLETQFDHAGAFASSDGTVTSEAQAYALLRAAWTGDRATFERVWQWTAAHLLNDNGLLAWHWQAQVVDRHSATDADTDTALALLMAGRQWSNPEWLTAGTRMVSAIWDHDVALIDGTPYVAAGDWAPPLDVVAVNPSYFAPYAYHVFREVDPAHDWTGVIDAGYQALFDSASNDLAGGRSAGLPPDWYGIDRASGAIVPLALDTTETTNYGYDAPRAYWRIALDWRWDADGRASAFLAQAGFLRDEVSRTSGVGAVYAHDGSVLERRPSLVATAGAVAALLTLDPPAAHQLYAGQLLGGAQRGAVGVYWGDPDDLYAQEWGWFGTALYADVLPDLWHLDEPPPT